MSSSWLDDALEARRVRVLAEALGITAEEVEQWVENDYVETSDDGHPYGHVVEISSDAPPALIEQLGGTSVNLGILHFDEGSEEE